MITGPRWRIITRGRERRRCVYYSIRNYKGDVVTNRTYKTFLLSYDDKSFVLSPTKSFTYGHNAISLLKECICITGIFFFSWKILPEYRYKDEKKNVTQFTNPSGLTSLVHLQERMGFHLFPSALLCLSRLQGEKKKMMTCMIISIIPVPPAELFFFFT